MATEPTPTQAPKAADAVLPGSAEALLVDSRIVPGLIRLPAGVELNEDSAEKMSSERSIRLIVLAGAIDCGKTTLLSSLYEMFQGGPVEKKQFAGCETFPAFEKKCHPGRTDSGNTEEATVRNTYDGPHPEYVHIKLQNGPKALGHIDFLFTDVSGEMFEYARNSTIECKKLTFLHRACHIVVFLDCEKLFTPTKRWGMVKDARSLIQSCLDSKMLEPDVYVTVVWAKYDFVEAAKAKEKAIAKATMQQVETEFKTAFSHLIKNFKFHQTAARPTRHPKLQYGFGVKGLLEDWVTLTPPARKAQADGSSASSGQGETETDEKDPQSAPTTE